jgi:hypothetical protein
MDNFQGQIQRQGQLLNNKCKKLLFGFGYPFVSNYFDAKT